MRRSRGVGQHTLVGAYVMDAVPGSDRAGFERHMLSCEQCREDVGGLREAAARLALAAAEAPPGAAPDPPDAHAVRSRPAIAQVAAIAIRRC